VTIKLLDFSIILKPEVFHDVAGTMWLDRWFPTFHTITVSWS